MQQAKSRSTQHSLASRWPKQALAALFLILAGGCAGVQQEASKQVDELFAPLATGVQPGAAVMVIRDGRIIHRAGYGYADLERRVPITADSAFNLASVSKQFTAMAVMILAAAGDLDYDDPVSRYLPQLSPYKGVTIRQLMTHTGGLPDYYDIIDTRHGMPSNAEALTLLGDMATPDFPPGERFAYSNAGYDMLGPLVEAVSGTDFATFMREQVFTPAGMRHSVVHDHTLPLIASRVYGYAPIGDGFRLDDDDPLNGIVGSGSMYSTLNDLFRWDQALYTDTLASRRALDEAFEPARLNDGTAIDYGFGWRLDRYDGRRRVRHGGSWVGFRCHIARYPEERFTVVILANRSDFQPERYVDAITDIYLAPRSDGGQLRGEKQAVTARQ